MNRRAAQSVGRLRAPAVASARELGFSNSHSAVAHGSCFDNVYPMWLSLIRVFPDCWSRLPVAKYNSPAARAKASRIQLSWFGGSIPGAPKKPIQNLLRGQRRTTWQTAKNAHILRVPVRCSRDAIAARSAKRWRRHRTSIALVSILDAAANRPEIGPFFVLSLLPLRKSSPAQKKFGGPRTQIDRERDSVATVSAQNHGVCALGM
jgi:hypothetical protein